MLDLPLSEEALSFWSKLKAVSTDSLHEAWLEECIKAAGGNNTHDQQPSTSSDGDSRDSQLNIYNRTDDLKENNKIPSKPHSTPMTLKWLAENYEIVEGVCIPRNTLYIHYLDFCNKNDCQPVNAASFGKIIRQQFPQITTRRLGTRGQSKYHYYGIAVKETSPYFDVMYSSQGIQNATDGKKDSSKHVVAYSPRSKLGTLLPEFPKVEELKLPPDVQQGKVVTFIMMYRTHCQRILDTVIRANFDEVQSFLLHFWQGMPQHIVPILGSPCISKLIGVCDSILYKAISGVLMPTVLQALPESLTQVIRKFAKQLDDWIATALEGLPENLRKMKFELSRRFAQSLRRQTALNHLCQASRTVIHSAEITAQMLEDWCSVDLNSICRQTLYTVDGFKEKGLDKIVSLCKEFESLLEDQEPIEAYTEWLDRMIDTCVVQPSAKKQGSLRHKARQFLLLWSFFGTRIIRDMTLHSAPSFGSFHLLHMMFDDYVVHHIECIHSQEAANELLKVAKGEKTSETREEDPILPNPSFPMISGSFNGQCMESYTGSVEMHPIRTQNSASSFASPQSAFTVPQQTGYDGGLAMSGAAVASHDMGYSHADYPIDGYSRASSQPHGHDATYGMASTHVPSVGQSAYLPHSKMSPEVWSEMSSYQPVIQRNNVTDVNSFEYSSYQNYNRNANDSFLSMHDTNSFYNGSPSKRSAEDGASGRSHKRVNSGSHYGFDIPQPFART